MKVQKLHHDLEEQIHTNTQLLAENSQKQVELKVKEDEIAQASERAGCTGRGCVASCVVWGAFSLFIHNPLCYEL